MLGQDRGCPCEQTNAATLFASEFTLFGGQPFSTPMHSAAVNESPAPTESTTTLGSRDGQGPGRHPVAIGESERRLSAGADTDEVRLPLAEKAAEMAVHTDYAS